MSLGKRSVCLQINLASSDVRYAVHTVPHQMRALANQVDEIQFTLDTRHLRTSRYRTNEFEKGLSSLRTVLAECCSHYPHAYVTEIDFSKSRIREISESLQTAGDIPVSAFNGSPFYGYIFGLYQTNSRFVLHLDADMLFGGGSQSWVEQAITLLSTDRRILAVNPLGGPPTATGEIAQEYVERIPVEYPAFTFRTISSRIFLAERERLLFEYTVPLMAVRGMRRVQALINNVPTVLPFEECLSDLLAQHDCFRLDMLGTNPGLWSLHPPYRSETFYKRLPDLIEQIEGGNVPEGQRGDFDLNDSMIDWADVRRRNGLGSKLLRYLSYAKNGILERSLGR
jgi:hypothetical protein